MSDVANRASRSRKGSVTATTAIIIVGGLVIVALVGVIVALVMNLNRGETQPREASVEQRAVVVNEENADEILDEIFSEPAIEPGYYEVNMNMVWTFPDGASPAKDAYVENVPSNSHDVYFDITLRGTDETIYESPVLPRGTSLRDVTLSKDLDAGQYDCVMTYHLVDEEQRTVSTLNMAMTIIVES
jgi:hypothetical protein